MFQALWFGHITCKFDLEFTVNALLAITYPCYWVSPFGAVIIGAIAGLVIFIATNLFEYLKIHEPTGNVPVHVACGRHGHYVYLLLGNKV
jgi:ammonium transporter, Amt family